MLHFLQSDRGAGTLIPSTAMIREKIAEKEMKIDLWFDQLMGMLVEYTPRVVSALLVLLVGLWFIKRIARLAEKTMERRELDVSLRSFLKSLTSIGLKIILIVTVAGMVGVGTASFVTILGAAGLAVGLALQGSLSNFAGGVLILIFKPFRVGDSIEAGGQSGTVVEIQIFNTVLLTGERKTVILPNGPLSNGTIVNTTRYGSLRLDMEFRIDNTNDLDKVRLILLNTIAKNPKVLTSENIEIVVGKASEGMVQINARPYSLPAHTGDLQSELYAEVKKAFETNGVKLAVMNLRP